MRWTTATVGGLILFLLGGAQSGLAQTPTITNVTNAAIPAIDYPPVAVQHAPRSIATIFGTNLADSVVSTAPPWKTALGGTEVHFVVDTKRANRESGVREPDSNQLRDSRVIHHGEYRLFRTRTDDRTDRSDKGRRTIRCALRHYWGPRVHDARSLWVHPESRYLWRGLRVLVFIQPHRPFVLRSFLVSRAESGASRSGDGHFREPDHISESCSPR